MDTKSVVGVLNRLYRTTRAGEMGFNTVSGVVRNRGLKVLLKSFAQQRRRMADEVAAEIKRLGGEVTDRRSFPGMVHRGRVAIVGTMIINEERTTLAMLKEAAIGEKAATRRYRSALEKDLPEQTKTLLTDHLQQIEETATAVDELRGQQGERLVVRMFKTQQHADEALQTLHEEGVDTNRVEIKALDTVATAYRGQSAVLSEVLISGAVGGSLWGGLLGTFAGAGLVIGAGISPLVVSNPQTMWALIILVSLLSGALVGAILGLFIGVGFKEEDNYLYNGSLDDQGVLLMLRANAQQALAASTTLHRLSAKAQAQASGTLQAA